MPALYLCFPWIVCMIRMEGNVCEYYCHTPCSLYQCSCPCCFGLQWKVESRDVFPLHFILYTTVYMSFMVEFWGLNGLYCTCENIEGRKSWCFPSSFIYCTLYMSFMVAFWGLNGFILYVWKYSVLRYKSNEIHPTVNWNLYQHILKHARTHDYF